MLEEGTGPLALCLHGFPDTAHTWRYLLPALANTGFRAVAPFMRGYAPTSTPADGCFELGALVADAAALHDVLGADESAVLIGHDWGAEAAYGAGAFAPERWRRLVTLAIPPLSLDAQMFADYEQLKRSFYHFFLACSCNAQATVAADNMAFLDHLWADWSPGYDAAVDLRYVKRSLNDPARLKAAIDYYRAPRAPSACMYRGEQEALDRQPQQPTLFLYGTNDGCVGAEFSRLAIHELAPSSQVIEIESSGHFPHLEAPDEVNQAIIAWVAQ
jgi:pimeloyl-ACP methyl ester carboxylesterase